MANRERGEVSVEVKGRKFTLRPSYNGVCELEDLTGKTVDQFQELVNQGRRSGIRAVVWMLLNENHGDEIRTLKDASQWIEDAGGEEAIRQHIEAVLGLNSEGIPEESGSGNPPGAQAGTGDAPSLPLAESA